MQQLAFAQTEMAGDGSASFTVEEKKPDPVPDWLLELKVGDSLRLVSFKEDGWKDQKRRLFRIDSVFMLGNIKVVVLNYSLKMLLVPRTKAAMALRSDFTHRIQFTAGGELVSDSLLNVADRSRDTMDFCIYDGEPAFICSNGNGYQLLRCPDFCRTDRKKQADENRKVISKASL